MPTNEQPHFDEAAANEVNSADGCFFNVLLVMSVYCLFCCIVYSI